MNNIDKIHNTLKSKLGYKGTVEDLSKYLEAPDNVSKVVKTLNEKVGYKGTVDDFNSYVGLQVPKVEGIQNVSAPSVAVGIPEVNVMSPLASNMPTTPKVDWATQEEGSMVKPIGGELEREQPVNFVGMTPDPKNDPDYSVINQSGKFVYTFDKEKSDRRKEKDAFNTILDEQEKRINQMTDSVGANIRRNANNVPTNQFIPAYSGAAISTTQTEDGKAQGELLAAQTILKDAKQAWKAPKKGENWAKSFGIGGSETVTDPDAWLFGVLSLNEVGQSLPVFEKVEKGEPLTDTESAVMDAMLTRTQAEAMRSSDTSNWYKGGKIAGESLPFMRDMALTGGLNTITTAGGKGAVSLAQKATAKYLRKKAEKQLLKEGIDITEDILSRRAADLFMRTAKGADYAGRVLAAFTVTPAARLPLMPTSYSGVAKSMQPKVVGDEFGTYQIQEGDDFGTAVGKQFVEVQSEGVGEFFAPILKGVKLLGGKAIPKIISDSKFGQVGSKVVDAIMLDNPYLQKAGVSGIAGEVGEEIFGQTEQYLSGLTTKEDLDNFYSGDNFKSMLIGFAPMSALGMAGNAINYGSNEVQYRRAKKELGGITDELDNSSVGELGNKISYVLIQNNAFDEEGNLTEDGRRLNNNLVSYAQRKMAKDIANDGKQENPNSRYYDFLLNDRSKKWLESYLADNDLTAPMYFNLAYKATLHENELTDYEIKTLSELDRAFNGYLKAEDSAQQASAEIDAQVNPTNNKIQNVTIGGQPYTVKGGNIAMTENEEGKAILDKENSDQVITVVNAEGIPSQIGIEQLESVVGEVDAEEAKNAAIESAHTTAYNETFYPVGSIVYRKYAQGQFYAIKETGADGFTINFVNEGGEAVPTLIENTNSEIFGVISLKAGDKYTLNDGTQLDIISNEGGVISASVNGQPSEQTTADELATLFESTGIDLAQFEPVVEEVVETPEIEAQVPEVQVEETQAAEQPEATYPTDKKGEPIFEQMPVEQSVKVVREFLGDDAVNFVEDKLKAANKAVKSVSKKAPKSTSLLGRKAEVEAIALEKQKAAESLDYWTNVKRLMSEEAIQATREQTPINQVVENPNQVGQVIIDRYESAKKVIGNPATITAPNGKVLKGRYVLVSAYSVTPSHNPFDGYNTSEGFPLNADGSNTNQRDYKNDKANQVVTEEIANAFGGQALESVPKVSKDGVVLDGNGRTIASQLAAANGTDKAYLEALNNNAANYGFTASDLKSVSNPRIVFELETELPYTTEAFAMFNSEEKKSESATASAVGKSKQLSPSAIAKIAALVDSYSSLESFFSSETATAEMVKTLVDANVINTLEIAKLIDNGLFSATGRELITNVLLGATLNEQAIRQIGNDSSLKGIIVRAMKQILENAKLKEYSLFEDLNNAIGLMYEARKAKMTVSEFLLQTNMFEKGASERFSDFEQMLALAMSGSGVLFKGTIDKYNTVAAPLVGGQVDMFTGRIMDPNEVKQQIIEYYGKTKSIINPNAGVDGRNRSSETARTDSGRISLASAQAMFDAATTAEEKHKAALEITLTLDEQNNTTTIVAKDNEQFIAMLPAEYAETIRKKRVVGVFIKGKVIVNAEKMLTGEEILLTYEHEWAHSANRNVHSFDELAELWNNSTDKKVLPRVYLGYADNIKGDELIAHIIEDIIQKQGYENYKNGNIDLSLYSQQEQLKKTIDYANKEYLRNVRGGDSRGNLYEDNNARKGDENLQQADEGRQTPKFRQKNEGTSGQVERNVQENVSQGGGRVRKSVTTETLLIDGVERPTRNSNGAYIHSTEEGVRNFYAWFGDSKVVDNEGRPLVVYHGSPKRFDEFKPKSFGTAGLHEYYYFAKSKKWVEKYLAEEPKGAESPVIGKYFIGVSNPLDLTGKTLNAEQWVRLFEGLGVNLNQHITDKLLAANKNQVIPVWQMFRYDTPQTSNLRDELMIKGYDGLIISDVVRGKMDNTSFIAFSPSQIKSATDNNGEFSPETGDIRFKMAYHGSPHNFDKFSISNIGTGEGAQAYGWGLYFTDKKGIAEKYANMSNNMRIYYDGKEITSYEGSYYIRRHLSINNNILDTTLENAYKEAMEDYDIIKSPQAKRIAEEIKSMLSNPDLLEVDNSRNLYVVKIHGEKTIDELNFMRWDKPITKKQQEAVKEIFNDLVNTQTDYKLASELSNKLDKYDFENKTGQDIYKELSNIIGTAEDNADKKASLMLLDYGIDGIQYPTEYLSKGAHEGDYNYVVFDENVIEIEDHIRFKIAKSQEELDDFVKDSKVKETVYHATNSTWTEPEISGLGFHAGTLKAAKDRMKSFSMDINPHIKMCRFNLKNPLYIGRDYRFHNNLSKVVTELYKDKVITKSEKEDLIGNIYSDRATFDNLRKLLHDKYGYDGIIYRNNIEDRGSDSYIAFYPEQVLMIPTDNTDKFSESNEDIRYKIIGEQGARNLDAAEEATTRLDNLQVAKEMESPDNFKWSDRASNTILDNPFVEGVPTPEKAKQINDWIKSNTDKYNPKYVKFYHSTDKILPIEKEGLLPTSEKRRRSVQSESGYVYLANTPERAKIFGEIGNPYGHEIYEVIVPISELKADTDQLNNQRAVGNEIGNTIGESIVYGGGVRIKGKIEPWQIHKIKTSKTPQEIRLATGWERGVDGLWRYEVPDVDTTTIETNLRNNMTDDGKSWEAFQLSDFKDIAEAYPDINVDGIAWVNPDNQNTGSYSPATEGTDKYFGKTAAINVYARDVESVKNVLIHEIQHAIQAIEGFANGGNTEQFEDYSEVAAWWNDEGGANEETPFEELTPKEQKAAIEQYKDEIGDYNTFDNYRRLAGEVESRNVESRMNMTPEQRRETLLSETEDVAREDQIFLYESLTAMNATTPETITINGVERPTTNSNGKPIAQTEEGIRNFWRWFGNSKVTDESGRPLVVYHGGASNITQFDAQKAGAVKYSDWGKGIYFTPSEMYADMYRADYAKSTDDIANRLYDEYVEEAKKLGTTPMDKSIDLGYGSEKYKYLSEYEQKWRNRLNEVKNTQGEVYPVYLNISKPLRYRYEGITDPFLSEQAISNGNDGIIVTPMTEYIVFSPSQIKSATDNIGEFSESSDDIRFKIEASKIDSEYFAAIERGDMDEAQRIVDQQAVKKGYISNTDYRMMHQAPNREDHRASELMDNDVVPSDYWTHPQYYQYERDEFSSFYKIKAAIEKAKEGKTSKVWMYRAVPKNIKDDNFRNGDWITPSREYAQSEGLGITEGYRIITQRVDLNDLWWDANSINEFGFDDGKEYAYKNTKNNRKLTDVITRDYDGNIIPPSKRFNNREYDPRFSIKSPIGFYSTVENALDKIQQEKGTKEQFQKMLLNNGAKQAEMDWMGFDELPEKLTKTDIQNWIDENRIEVEEVEKGEKSQDINQIAIDKYGVKFEELSSDEKQSVLNDFKGYVNDTKFSQYVLPGGENYKELLLTMPYKNKLFTEREILAKQEREARDNEDYVKALEIGNKIGEITKKLIEQKAFGTETDFRSSHFDEPNILAHIRFDERTVNGERVLFIEEIQSDWNQSIKKKGIRQGYDKSKLSEVTPDRYNEMGISPEKFSLITYENENGQEEQVFQILKSQYPTVKDAINYISTSKIRNEGEPDNPFKKTDQWVNLSIRRMMRYAAENGFDRIAWTNGEQQADRYDLSKQIKELEIITDKDDENRVEVWVNNDLLKYANKEELPDIIGKEMAQKAVSDLEKRKKVYYSGLDLKVGGEGMKAFYDAIVPSAMNKLGKPFGAKVENISIKQNYNGFTLTLKDNSGNVTTNQFDSKAQAYSWLTNAINNGSKYEVISEEDGVILSLQQSIPVTESMKESVMEGVPLFAIKAPKFEKGASLKEMVATSNMFIAARADKYGAKGRRMVESEIKTVGKAINEQSANLKESANLVTDMVKALLNNGSMNNMTRAELSQILTNVRNASNKKDLTKEFDKISSIVRQIQLRNAKRRFNDLMKFKVQDKNAKGISIASTVDDETVSIITTIRKSLKELTLEDVENQINEINNLEKKTTSDEIKLVGLGIARDYMNEIKTREAQLSQLAEELSKAKEELVGKKGEDRTSDKELVESIENMVGQVKAEMTSAYDDLSSRLNKIIAEGKEALKNIKLQDKERVATLSHFVNSDMKGIEPKNNPEKGRTFKQWLKSNLIISPLQSFDFMLRSLAPNQVAGNGYLHDHFSRGILSASQNAYEGTESAFKMIDEAVAKIFGDKFTFRYVSARDFKKMSKYELTYGTEKSSTTITATNGQLAYIYAVNKMTDGAMKLRAMGISEEQVEEIKAALPVRIVKLVDAIQDEILPKLRVKYNNAHLEIFNTSMAAIENYVPLHIDKTALAQKVDLEEESAKLSGLIKNSTNSLIKRTVNTKPIDIRNSDFSDLITNHIKDMEQWAAYASIRRDMNTLLSNRNFTNRLIEIGGFEYLVNFKRAAAIAADVYQPLSDSYDTAITGVARTVATSKVMLNLYTAFKQVLSVVAYLTEPSPKFQGKVLVNLAKGHASFKWAKDNLPDFRKRWESSALGDEKLSRQFANIASEGDFVKFMDASQKVAQKYGMYPNKLVDSYICAVGAKSLYETNYDKYISMGATEEVARERALVDAVNLYNTTQQSSESMFVSSVQLDRTFFSTAYTVFNNSSLAYNRQVFDAARNLKNAFNNRANLIENRTKFNVRTFNISEEAAKKAAVKEVDTQIMRDVLRLAVFGYGVQLIWRLGASFPYLLFGDDDDKKKKMVKEAATGGALITPIRGLLFGATFESFIDAAMFSENMNMALDRLTGNIHPVVSDVDQLAKAAFSKSMTIGKAGYLLVNLFTKLGFGIDLKAFSNATYGFVSLIDSDELTANDVLIDIMSMLSVPQSQLKALALDNPETFFDRYIELKELVDYGLLAPILELNPDDLDNYIKSGRRYMRRDMKEKSEKQP